MEFDYLSYPYPSRRGVLFAAKGMVASSQGLAAEVGLHMLKKGGNAVDAAVAAAICLTVVEPTSNGIGGDAFALVWANGELHGLNASGPAPARLTAKIVGERGFTQMPTDGWLPVTVPGTPAAWQALSRRLGRLPFAELFEPAIEYARAGYPVSPVISVLWQKAAERFKKCRGEEFAGWFKTFAPEGETPRPGSVVKLPAHARTLDLIAHSGAEEFYRGAVAEQITDFAAKTGGFLSLADLSNFSAEWVKPLSVNYRGYDVWELPPNGHGLTVLLALNILRGFDLKSWDADTVHRQIEAVKLAFADSERYVSDPRYMTVTAESLLSPEYADRRRKLIGRAALTPAAGSPEAGGTVYLAAADGEGNMVSYIQSNYQGFGSGLVVPDTGVALHNRGANFSLDPRHDNCLAPGKKPYHTIIPGFLTKDGRAVGPFGVMGGFMQPQGHVQILANMLDFQLNPQAALDAPRWQWLNGRTVEVEHTFPDHLAQQLSRRGHELLRPISNIGLGRGQIIWRQGEALAGATEPRADGLVAVW
jgi:gamma-glutamyltranspeptidase/glutathione hydrolase